jgi:hypothetical protein
MTNRTGATFRALDAEYLARTFNLEASAQEGSASRIDAERGVARAFSDAHSHLKDQCARIAARLESKLENAASAPEAITHHFAQGKAAIAAVGAAADLELGALQRKRAALARDRRALLARHEASGSSDVLEESRAPDSAVLATGALIAAASVEAVGTAMLFADARGVGLLEAYLLAIMLSAINVAIGYLGGYIGVRTLVKRGRINRILGLGALGLSLLSGVVLNVTAMNWRWQLQAAAERGEAPSADAGFSLIDRIFAGESVILWMLGALTFTLALAKGATRNSHAQQRFAEMNAAADSIDSAIDGALAKVRAAMESAIAPHAAKIEAQRAACEAHARTMEAVYAESEANMRQASRESARLIALGDDIAQRYAFAPPNEPALDLDDILAPSRRLVEDARARAMSCNGDVRDALLALTRDMDERLAALRRSAA